MNPREQIWLINPGKLKSIIGNKILCRVEKVQTRKINQSNTYDVLIESSSKSDVTKESETRFFWAEGKTKLQRMTGMTYI
jgi:hypothetical protein